MPATLRFALIGAGRIGPVHAATLAHCVPQASLSAVAAAGVKLQVSFNRRFDSNVLRVRQAVASGEVGTPASFAPSAAIPSRRRSPISTRQIAFTQPCRDKWICAVMR